MNPEQIKLVQSSFAKVRPIAEPAAAIFYSRLFELAPQVRPLFKGDMGEQGRKLMAMLSTDVNSLSELDGLIPVAQKMAVRHVGYGALPEHYTVVGQALLDTLKAGLGNDFTPKVREAWSTAYGALSSAMIEAHHSAERP